MLLRYGILADWLEFRAVRNYTGLDNEELRFPARMIFTWVLRLA